MERWTALLPDRPGQSSSSHHSAIGRRLPPPPPLIGRLPAEAYLSVLSYLPIPDIPQFARCSRACARLTRDDRLWRRKLEWLDYKGPGQVDWRASGVGAAAAGGGVVSPTSAAPLPPYRDVVPAPAPAPTQPKPAPQAKPPPLISTEEDDFGDFFGAGAEPAAVAAPAPADDDDFGDFADQDDSQVFGDFGAFGASPKPNGTAAGGLNSQFGGLQVGVKSKAADDLLSFEDDDDGNSPQPPRPPIAQAQQTRPQLGVSTSSIASAHSSVAQLSFAVSSSPTSPTAASASSLLSVFKLYHAQLLPYYLSLLQHTTSSLLFTQPSLTPLARAHLLATLARFVQPELAPSRSLPQRLTATRNIGAAADFFEAAVLAEFGRADERGDEGEMREKVEILVELNGGQSAVQVFVQKRETVFDQSYDPRQNLTKILNVNGDLEDGIDFNAMDLYIQSLVAIIAKEGGRIARVFPAHLDALLSFFDHLATEVVAEYIGQLLSAAQGLKNPLFLLATAATFGQVHRLVPAVLEVEPKCELVTSNRVEDVVWRLFEPFMADYLNEEGAWVRTVLERLCADWDDKVAQDLATSDATFLKSSNPAQVKKNVLAGFTEALLLPVTIIPKTAAFGLNVLTTGATGAFNTFAQFGTTIGGQLTRSGTATNPGTPTLNKSPASLAPAPPVVVLPAADSAWGEPVSPEIGVRPPSPTPSITPSVTPSANGGGRFDKLQLLLSLDVALQLIQADRDCLKRVQTFAGFPAETGKQVRDGLEEVFIVLLQTLGDKHVGPAFARATREMSEWKPNALQDSDEREVAPLVQFFELVHVGDTIGQMVHVYWEKEMARFVDARDFLNVVVREKKKFEHLIDDAVAGGLNAGVNLLMVQVEHLLQVKQGPRDFAPPEGEELELRATSTCGEVIDVLRKHCDMLKGSTDKQILEVFHQEVGIRLHGILLKHLKRLIVSLQGGFQLISDLNAYHAFVQSLRQPNITAYFSALKMVGEIYIIEDPKDLGQLVKDVARYEGTLSPDDLYELVQRRADWKKIEKQVEKQLFGLKLADDCVCM